jgi:DNA-binding response OmpR family regulator
MPEKSAISSLPKVLVIDDEKLLRNSIKKILERANLYVETAMDYLSAKQAVDEKDFDLLLVDIVLPKMSGLQMVEKLQKESGLKSQIIFFTGEPNLENAIHAIRLGATDYLEKPVNPPVLLDAVQRALNRGRYLVEISKEQIKHKVTISNNLDIGLSTGIGDDVKPELEDCVEKTHKALVELKKKFGDSFTEEQRDLLNQIAKSNSRIMKLLKQTE